MLTSEREGSTDSPAHPPQLSQLPGTALLQEIKELIGCDCLFLLESITPFSPSSPKGHRRELKTLPLRA